MRDKTRRCVSSDVGFDVSKEEATRAIKGLVRADTYLQISAMKQKVILLAGEYENRRVLTLTVGDDQVTFTAASSFLCVSEKEDGAKFATFSITRVQMFSVFIPQRSCSLCRARPASCVHSARAGTPTLRCVQGTK